MVSVGVEVAITEGIEGVFLCVGLLDEAVFDGVSPVEVEAVVVLVGNVAWSLSAGRDTASAMDAVSACVPLLPSFCRLKRCLILFMTQ